jgi:hypothetical protein
MGVRNFTSLLLGIDIEYFNANSTKSLISDVAIAGLAYKSVMEFTCSVWRLIRCYGTSEC